MKEQTMNEIDLTLTTILTTLQGLLLSVILFTMKRDGKTPHRLLSFLIVTLTLITFTGLKFKNTVLQFEEIQAVLYYLLGPFVYLYIHSFSSDSKSNTLAQLKHFIPASIMISLFLFSYLPIASYNFVDILYEYHWIGSALIEFIYLICTMMLLLKYRKTVKQSSVGSEQQLPTFFIIFLSIYLTLFVIDICVDLFDTNELLYKTLPLLLTSIWFFAIIYLLLQWPREYEEVKTVLKSEQKYKKCTLSESESNTIFVQITTALTERKLYLDPNLTLQSLANDIGATTHEVSFCINRETEENFATFIGRYRVNESIQLLGKSELSNYSIQQVALQSGFSSKSTFNRIFKKITDKTPSQFKNTL